MLKNTNTPPLTPEEKLQKELSGLIEDCDILEMAANLVQVLALELVSHQQRRDLIEVIGFLHAAARVQLDPEARKLHEVA